MTVPDNPTYPRHKPQHMAPRQPLALAQIIVAIAFVMLVAIVVGSLV